MIDWVSEVSTSSPEDLLLLEDGWGDFLTKPDQGFEEVTDYFKKKDNLRRFQQMIIFLKKLDASDQSNDDNNNSNEATEFLSGLSREELNNFYKNYSWLLKRDVDSPFDRGLSDKEVLDRTRKAMLLSLFDYYSQESDRERKELFLTMTRVVNQSLFGFMKSTDGCFVPIISKDIVNLKTARSQKKLPPLVWENIENGSYLIYPPKRNGHNSFITIGDYCIELKIQRPSLEEQRTVLSYKAKDPYRVLGKTEGNNCFGLLVFTDYRNEKKELKFKLVETRDGSISLEL